MGNSPLLPLLGRRGCPGQERKKKGLSLQHSLAQLLPPASPGSCVVLGKSLSLSRLGFHTYKMTHWSWTNIRQSKHMGTPNARSVADITIRSQHLFPQGTNSHSQSS